MVEGENVRLLSLIGFILIGTGLYFLFRVARKQGVKEKVLLFLILMTLIGLLLFTFSYRTITSNLNLGRPLTFDKLVEDQELRTLFWCPYFAIVYYEKQDQVDCRFVVGLPPLLPGEKFYKHNGKIYREFPGKKSEVKT